MANLKHAHNELFRRSPDECFDSLDALIDRCRRQRESSSERWHAPDVLTTDFDDASLQLCLGSDGAFALNHWSFSQLVGLCGVSRDTINALSPQTASRALQETKPTGSKPLQLLTCGQTIRAMHGTQYSRLWNDELLATVQEAAPDFEPPQKAITGGTGLYCGEQDMFAFVIDPAGWTEIDGQQFAPGMFVWNSEVGKRSIGIQTFWWQAVCCNHIVWDAVEVVDFSRKHTGNVGESLVEMQRIIESLVARRDERRDGFAIAVSKAMKSRIGDADDATEWLLKNGITRAMVKRAVKKLGDDGKPFTIFSLVDAITQLTQEVRFVGDRTETDAKASRLLALAV